MSADLSLDQQTKIQLSYQLTQILEFWKLSDQEQIVLLSLPSSFKERHLYLYRQGNKSFDFTETMMQRSKIILGIYAALGTTYPTNRDYASVWLRQPFRKFKDKTPLALMLSGETGMKRVWYFLDCTESWQD